MQARFAPSWLMAAFVAIAAATIGSQPSNVDAGRTTTTYNYTVSSAATQPVPGIVGSNLTIATGVKATAAGSAVVSATITSGKKTYWQYSWPSATFVAGETKSLSTAWSVPATQPTGTYTLTVRVKNSSGAEVAKALATTFTLSAPSGGSGTGTGTGSECTMPTIDSEEQALLNQINQYRQANGRSALSMRCELARAAQWMSDDMASKSYFSHTDSLGRDPATRMSAFGYTYATKGENIAAGNQYGVDVFNQWKSSSTHNSIMLSTSYVTIGIGRAFNSASAYGWYWTADFGGN